MDPKYDKNDDEQEDSDSQQYNLQLALATQLLSGVSGSLDFIKEYLTFCALILAAYLIKNVIGMTWFMYIIVGPILLRIMYGCIESYNAILNDIFNDDDSNNEGQV